jgi:hypothetical protein
MNLTESTVALSVGGGGQTTSLAGSCSTYSLSVLLSHLQFTVPVNWTKYIYMLHRICTHEHTHMKHAVVAKVAYVTD